jgi:DNA-binding NarL/FixJ family response regulator
MVEVSQQQHVGKDIQNSTPSQPQNSIPIRILVIDDHQLILNGTLDVLKRNYPDGEFFQVKTARDALEQIEKMQAMQTSQERSLAPLSLIVIDLSIPEQEGLPATTDTGIGLVEQIFKRYPEQNILVQSSYVKALVRIKHEIDNHQGGFAIADKSLPEAEMLSRAISALQGATHTKEIRTGIELKPDWFMVLRLAFDEGLMDKAIAERMFKSERAIRTYWTKIQDVLGVYPEDCKEAGKSLRTQTEIRARQEGLIN